MTHNADSLERLRSDLHYTIGAFAAANGAYCDACREWAAAPHPRKFEGREHAHDCTLARLHNSAHAAGLAVTRVPMKPAPALPMSG